MIGGFGMLSMKYLLYTLILLCLFESSTAQTCVYTGMTGVATSQLNKLWTTTLCACNAGFSQQTSQYNRCTECASGRFKSSAANWPASFFLSTGAVDTTIVIGGAAYINDMNVPGACQKCPINTVSPLVFASTSCTACPAGSITTGTGSGPNSCFLPCPAGQYHTFPPRVCTNCPEGKYSATAGSSACTSCPAGGESTPAGSTACVSGCAVGTTGPDGGTCTACVAGKYKTSSGSVVCTDCVVNTYSATGGASTSSVCSACPTSSSSAASSSVIAACICNAGFTGANGGSCSACVAGKYKTSSGSTVCTDCSTATYSATVGASASSVCSSCPVNKISPVSSSAIDACTCNAGFTGPDAGVCSGCVVGKYKTSIGSAACTDCGGIYSACQDVTFLLW